MKRDDLKQLRELTIDELRVKAHAAKEQLFTLRFQMRTGHLADFSRVRATRREYAKIQTVISQKRLSEAKHGAA